MKNKSYKYIISSLFIVLFIVLFVLMFQNKKYSSQLYAIQLREAEAHEPYVEEQEDVNWYIESWENSLRKMSIQADAVFFGDSITFGSNFQVAFKDKVIVNMGIPGNGVGELTARADMLTAVNPKKIFIMIGINGLKADAIEYFKEKYQELIDAVRVNCPDAKIYLQSVLPISVDQELAYTDNNTIIQFNEEIENLSNSNDCTYIDIHKFYYDGSQLKPEVTTDGIHLKSEAYQSWIDLIRAYIYE